MSRLRAVLRRLWAWATSTGHPLRERFWDAVDRADTEACTRLEDER